MINRLIANTLPLLPERFVWLFSRSYIAGEDVEDAMAACRSLNADGIKTTIDILGEFIRSLDEARKNRDEYLSLVETAQGVGIDGSYSVKPTMFGLLIDTEVCYAHIRDIVAKAADYDNFIRIDMEDSGCVDLEIDLFRRLKAEFPKNVGLVLQAYLRRTKKRPGKPHGSAHPERPAQFPPLQGHLRRTAAHRLSAARGDQFPFSRRPGIHAAKGCLSGHCHP